jgi:hypothetical protein
MSFWQLSPGRVVEVVDEELVVVVVEVIGGIQHPFVSHFQSTLEVYLSLQSWAVTHMTFLVQFDPLDGHIQHGPYLE